MYFRRMIMATDHNIVPPHLAVQAMRDNGYRNTAYAIAELIDNSIQADAKNVELLIAEKKVMLKSNINVDRIHEIAVLDDGCGMDEKILRLSLQFGNGTHLKSEERNGIGHFGMGLPSSSISQCTKVDIWSWQDGVDKAYHTFLDINQVNQKKLTEIPKPKKEKIPERYKKVGKSVD